jgi:fimbrial chaperone protein
VRRGCSRLVAGLLALGSLTLPAGKAAAAALRVSPVSFELARDQRAATLNVRNEGDTAMNVQVRVFQWSQASEKDVLSETTDLVASPPFTSLEARSEQIVRLVRPGAQAADHEVAYRLLVDELPPAGDPSNNMVQLLMRHSLPVFVRGPNTSPAKVAWRAGGAAGGAIALTGVNTGGRHIRVANVQITDAGGHVLAGQTGLVGYVLAGATTVWSFPRSPGAPPAGAPVRLSADTDTGRIDVALAGAS